MNRCSGIFFLGIVAMLSGCGTVYDAVKKTGQVLMDPSIQVGSAEDQPTQIALSLYANHDVNPNPDSPAPSTASDNANANGAANGYEIYVNSPTRTDLVENLQATLKKLKEDPSYFPIKKENGPIAVQAPPADTRTRYLPQRISFRIIDADDTASELIPKPFRVSTAISSVTGSNLSISSLPPLPPPPPLPKEYASMPNAIPAPSNPSNLTARKNTSQIDEDDDGDQDAALPAPSAINVKDKANTGFVPGQYRSGVAITDAPAPTPSSTQAAPTPIAFKILQLKDDSLLLNASRDQLQQNLKQTLGSTYLHEDDYVLVPGQFKFINFRPIDGDTNFIAIVADFHDTNAATWKDVFRVDPKGRKYPLLIVLQGTSVAITDESRRPAQNSPRGNKP